MHNSVKKSSGWVRVWVGLIGCIHNENLIAVCRFFGLIYVFLFLLNLFLIIGKLLFKLENNKTLTGRIGRLCVVAAIIASTYAAMNPQTKKSNMESGVESGVEMGLKTAPIGIQIIHLCIRWVMLVLMTALCSNLFK